MGHGPRVCFKRQSDGKPMSISYVSCGLRTSSNPSFRFTHASPDANNWQVRCFRLEDAGWCDSLCSTWDDDRWLTELFSGRLKLSNHQSVDSARATAASV